MKVCVIGLGYIGLPTASILATSGFKVIGVDNNRAVIEKVSNGMTDIKESGLQVLVEAAAKSGSLKSQMEVEEADIFIICVPTPISGTIKKKTDLSFVKQVAESIVLKLNKGNLVILESTVPPGTIEDILKPILEKSGLNVGNDFYLAYCPERVLPGNLLNELIRNDRVIGGIDRKSAELARKVYEKFVEGEIYLTDAKTAEFVKLMENTYRGTNIALANEFALISEKLGINVYEAIKLVNKHPRVNIHNPGVGVGGHCIPIDPWFIVEKAPELSKLIPVAMEINEKMPLHTVSLVVDAFSEAKKELKGSKIAVLGVAYKGDVNDARESPAIPIIRKLKELGAIVTIYDPLVTDFQFELVKELNKAVSNADALVIVTDHSEFKEMDLEVIKELMNDKPILVDGRNIIQNNKGFVFRGIGR